MARHISQGKWTTFYYGEAYVGSLGATVTAGAFLLFGESVATARAVQMAYYVGAIVFTYLLARRLSSQGGALVTALMMALPPVMVILYTTAGIGSYGETLLFGTILLWLGHRLAHEWAERWIAWFMWGAVAGLGFWSLGLIVVYMMPVALLWLLRFDRRRWPGYLLAGLGFLLCSSPWWIYDLTHNHAALRVLYDPSVADQVALSFSLLERLGGLLLLGIPALVGLRFPWQAEFILVVLAPLVLTFYIGALIGLGRRRADLSPTGRSGALLLVLFVAGFALLFIGTRFGIDATGRYLLPLYPPLCIAVGGWWGGLRSRARILGSVALALILCFHLAGVVLAAIGPPGLTSQFIPELQVSNTHDEALIDFLLENGAPYGYSHHWVSFKIAFLSQEQVVLAPMLPYLDTPNHEAIRANRYPPYTELAEAVDNPAYVTSNQPWMDELLRQRFAEQGIAFEEASVGPYQVFFRLSEPISPTALGRLSTREP
jgi:4-amino-4-deoxy-L-arabinose transferase-like glycosyltransferase